jgi:hypothetical protein
MNSSSKIQTLLAMTLPRLLNHPQTAVRQALAAAVTSLLTNAPRALHNSRQALIEILLTLANDDYSQVSNIAVEWLQGQGSLAADRQRRWQQRNDVMRDSKQGSRAAEEATDDVNNALRALDLPLLDAAEQQQCPPAGLAAASTSSSSSSSNELLSELLAHLVTDLPAAVRRNESSGIAAAKRAAAALLCAGESTSHVLLAHKGALWLT